MTPQLPPFDRTPTAAWFVKIKDHQPRLDYYSALQNHLEEELAPGTKLVARLSREDICLAAGHTSPSTMYDLFHTGTALRPPLLKVVDELRVRRRDSQEYKERGALNLIIAEASIADHWPHRLGWIDGLRRTRTAGQSRVAATTLVRILAGWASANPPLATADGPRAPFTAVDDLALVVGGWAQRAELIRLLDSVVDLATGPFRGDPEGVLGTVYDELMRVAFEPADRLEEVASRIETEIKELAYFVARNPDGARLLQRMRGRFDDVQGGAEPPEGA